LHHEVHLQSIQTETPVIITHKIVADWFNSMEPKEQLYHLNYKNREYQQSNNQENMDTVISYSIDCEQGEIDE
jgi:hypothetical protein